MSISPATPKTRLVEEGDCPRCSAHSGSTVWRVARTEPTSSTAMPRVRKTWWCERSTDLTEAACRPGGGAGSPTSRPVSSTTTVRAVQPSASQ
nr:hypothetical protein [Actinacidiphila yeochonensis]